MNFGIHGMALLVFAYYHAVVDLDSFIARKVLKPQNTLNISKSK